MAIEILLIRLFEVSTLIAFFVLTLTTGAFLVLLKSGLYFLGLAVEPTLAVIAFTASRCLLLIAWTLKESIYGFVAYGQKVLE